MNEILGFVFLCALVILFALFIPRNCNCSIKQIECEMTYCESLKQHDLKCCILIMFICIIFICTLAFGNYKPVIEYISFAGTITSIILSVLAIMMTLLSEASSNDAKVKMDNHLNLVQDLSDKADSQIKKIEELANVLSEKEANNEKIINKQNEMIRKQAELMNHVSYIEKNINRMSFKSENQQDWTNISPISDILRRREKNG